MEKIFFEGGDFRNRVLQNIEQAQTHIFISTYILGYDNFGLEVYKRLLDKSEEGVQVQLILDGFGSWKWLRNHESPISPNFQMVVFHPLPWPLGKWKSAPNKSFYFINRRNHHKMLICDKKTAIIGSRNLCVESLQWRETSAWLDGERVKELIKTFYWTWNHCQGQPPIKQKKNPALISKSPSVFTNHNFLERFRRHRILFQKLNFTQSHIYITTPYFFPPRTMLKTLLNKARDGRDIRILLPQRSDVKISQWIARSFYKELLKAGVRIYEYQAEILHAKTTIIDNWILLGSSNFNHRSFKSDLEVDIVLQEPKNMAELKAKFFADLQESQEVILPNWKGPSFLVKYFVRFLLIFSGWF